MDERIKRDKAKLRQRLKAVADSLPEDYITASDRGIEERLLASEAWKQTGSVFIYVSRAREPGTMKLIRAALQSGKTVAVPRIVSEGEMEARCITSVEDLHPGKFGILEPANASPLLFPEDIELVIVPCIAADRQGYRLGYGGGYYDRYLQKVQCTTVCLCRGELLQEELPHDVLDVSVSMVITEQEYIVCR